jgi:hypothetical protein
VTRRSAAGWPPHREEASLASSITDRDLGSGFAGLGRVLANKEFSASETQNIIKYLNDQFYQFR